MILGNLPEVSSVMAETGTPATEAVTPDTSSGSAVNTDTPTTTPTVTPTETATPTVTPTVTPDMSAYRLPATTLKARGGASRVRLSWSKASGAEGYYIYTRTAADAAYTLMATVKDAAATEYTKTSLVNGTTYYYRIAAYRTVNGVVVEDIVTLKVFGVVDKVVVNCIVSHRDRGVSHHILQVDRAVPLGAGIDLPLRDHFNTS